MVSSVHAATDFKCLNDCTSKGYQYNYCVSICSYPDTPPTGPGDFRPFDVGKVMMEAEQSRTMRAQREALEAQRAAELQRAEQSRERPAEQDSAEHFQELITQRMSEAIRYRRFKWPDFNQVALSNQFPTTWDMLALISESRYAADILYYLGQHHEEAEAISKMELSDAGPAIFEIERKIKQVEEPH